MRVLPVDVRYSDWDCTLEWVKSDTEPAIRLGLRMILGFDPESAQRISQARDRRTFVDIADLCESAALDRRQQKLLADAGALKALAGHRHRARWMVAGVERSLPLLDARHSAKESQIALPMPSADEDVRTDYATMGTTLGRHPLAFLRQALQARGCRISNELDQVAVNTYVRTAGLVRVRQQPQTASGVIFLTLEDEKGVINVVVWRQIAERQRRALLESQLLAVEGRIQRQDGVQHLIAHSLTNYSGLLGILRANSRDFR